MRILFAAVEASPLIKVGGLADVIGSLPRALTDLGHEVRTIIPAYSCLPAHSLKSQNTLSLTLRLTDRTESVNIQQFVLDSGRYFYLVRDSGLLCSPQVYTGNDLDRFLIFSRAVFDLLPHLDWQPEIVHCHDWHTALVPMWLKHSELPQASVFTIHNLAYQGNASRDYITGTGLDRFWSSLPAGIPDLPFSFIAQGILHADIVTTVSETYAREILTPEFGAGLDALLRYRRNALIGIVNGIDTDGFDPATDRYLAVRYDKSTPEGKSANKLVLQRRLNLPENIEVPVIGMVSRLDGQKGFDILIPALDRLCRKNIQLVVLGHGQESIETALKEAATGHPDKVAVCFGFAEDLAPLIYAGSDIFLMPSKFEPCGLGQMIAMRYGTVPVVRRTGGLADTVSDTSTDLSEGHGFVFDDYHPDAMLAAIDRALNAYQSRTAWTGLVRRIMSADFSWRSSAMKYEIAYKKALEVKRHARN